MITIQIIDEINWKIYPITHKSEVIEIEEMLLNQIGITKKFDIVNLKVIDMTDEEINNAKLKQEHQNNVIDIANKISELKQQLAEMDYKHIRQEREKTLLKYGKIFYLSMSEDEYLLFCEQQAKIVKQINELESSGVL